MACPDCKKKKLNPCGNCDYTVPTDCVEYTGDVLSFEDNNTKAGSNRTLTEILTDLSSYTQCNERPSKTIQGDYSIQAEDACKIILLDGSVTNVDVTYTIELPTSEDFIDKFLIFKDISSEGDPTGVVNWEFDTQIKYDWVNNTSTTSFKTLSNSLHKVLYLTFVKVGVNYQWIVVSPNSPVIERTDVDDGDLSNNWVNNIQFSYVRQGDIISLEGSVTGGNGGTNLFTLPLGYRPTKICSFITAVDGTPWLAIVNISTAGVINISVPGSSGIPITDNVFLDGISFNSI